MQVWLKIWPEYWRIINCPYNIISKAITKNKFGTFTQELKWNIIAQNNKLLGAYLQGWVGELAYQYALFRLEITIIRNIQVTSLLQFLKQTAILRKLFTKLVRINWQKTVPTHHWGSLVWELKEKKSWQKIDFDQFEPDRNIHCHHPAPQLLTSSDHLWNREASTQHFHQ